MSELRGLQLSLDEIRDAGATVAAISVDPPERNREVARDLDLEFPVLSDPEARTIRRFGLLHAAGAPDGSDIARPALFLVHGGEVRWRDLTSNWRVRARPEIVIDAVRTALAR